MEEINLVVALTSRSNNNFRGQFNLNRHNHKFKELHKYSLSTINIKESNIIISKVGKEEIIKMQEEEIKTTIINKGSTSLE